MIRFCACFLTLTLLSPTTASAVVVTESYDSWIRDEGLTLGDRDGDWLGVYNAAAGNGLPRWSVLEFDLSALAPLIVSDVSLGFWHMAPGSPVGSSDADPSRQTVSMITEVGAATAMPNFTWNQLNDPARVTLTQFESLGALELAGLAADPTEGDRYHYASGSAADIALIQEVIDSAGTLRIVLRSDESSPESLRVDWGDGPNDGGASHGQSAVLLINEQPPEDNVELTIQIDRLAGGIWLKNPGIEPTVNTTFDIDGYVLETDGENPGFNPAGFTGLSGAGKAGWQTVAAGASALSEVNLWSSTLLEEGDEVFLGYGYTPGAAPDPDVTFSYSVVGGKIQEGRIEFIELPTGDFNFDAIVDEADYAILRDHMQGHLDGSVSYENGDMDLDGDVDLDDFAAFKAAYPGGAASLAADLASGGIPEPATLLLLVAGTVGLLAVTPRSQRTALQSCSLSSRCSRSTIDRTQREFVSTAGFWQLVRKRIEGGRASSR